MITVGMATVIEANRARVWRALTEPAERVHWDPEILGAVDNGSLYPDVASEMRWRVRLGAIQTVLSERPQLVVPGERLRSLFTSGSLRYERTFVLGIEDDDVPRTRLSMKVVAANSVPVIGEIVDRFEVRRMTSERIDNTLRALQKWCEGLEDHQERPAVRA